jgi:ankyrin repeat protein
MKTKLNACWLLLLCLVVPIMGCSQNDGTVVGKHPISEFYDDPQMQELAAAAARGDVKTIDRLVSESADVNRQGKEGMQLLLWAIWADNEKGFLRLLEHSADPNAFTELGGSVIKFAAGAKNPAFLTMALEHGGDPNWTDPRSGEPIIFKTINPYSREPIKSLSGVST